MNAQIHAFWHKYTQLSVSIHWNYTNPLTFTYDMTPSFLVKAAWTFSHSLFQFTFLLIKSWYFVQNIRTKRKGLLYWLSLWIVLKAFDRDKGGSDGKITYSLQNAQGMYVCIAYHFL